MPKNSKVFKTFNENVAIHEDIIYILENFYPQDLGVGLQINSFTLLLFCNSMMDYIGANLAPLLPIRAWL